MAEEQTTEASQTAAEPTTATESSGDLAVLKQEIIGLRRRLGFVTGLIVADTAMIIVLLIMNR